MLSLTGSQGNVGTKIYEWKGVKIPSLWGVASGSMDLGEGNKPGIGSQKGFQL